MRSIHNALSYGRCNQGFSERQQKLPSCLVVQVPLRVPLDPHYKGVQRTDVEHVEEHEWPSAICCTCEGLCVRVTQFVNVVNSNFAADVVFDGYWDAVNGADRSGTAASLAESR